MKFTSSLKLKLIYVFRINDAAHRGCLKVGEATCDNDNVFGLARTARFQRGREETHQPIYTNGRYRIRPLIYGAYHIQLAERVCVLSTTRKCIAFWNVPALGKGLLT